MNIEMKKFLLSSLEMDADPCKGLVFRGYRSQFAYKGHIGERQGLKLLKRKSCHGCPKCGPILDSAAELTADLSILFDEIQDGALYTLTYTNVSRDWESGVVDDYDIAAELLPEEQQDRKKNWNGTRRM